MSSVWGETTQHFYQLTPDIIDRSIDQLGLQTKAQVLALNSLENRVYQVGLEDPMDLETSVFSKEHIIVKFYRPGRWDEATILEEHSFLNELSSLEIPVIAPMNFKDKTLFRESTTNLFYAVFPKVQGRLKDELNKEELREMGRLIARIHNVGRSSVFKNRPIFHPDNYLKAHFPTLKNSSVIPVNLLKNYLTLCQQLYEMIIPYFENLENQRLHGDFHRGNILWSDKGPWIVDFDDCSFGPTQQDLWLLVAGRDHESLSEREVFIESYNQMSSKPINLSQFIVEALRSIRMIHFNGWIAKRWDDPTFQNYYGDFNSEMYWESQLLDIKEQMGILQDSLYNDYQ